MTVERFNELVDRHSSKLYRLAYRLTGNAWTAEDMVQETFKSIWKSDSKIFEDREFSFLSTILRRRITDMRRSIHITEITVEDGVDGMVEDPVYIDGYSDLVQKALNQLDPQMRETLLLVIVGELTHVEVSEMLKVPIGTVLSRVDRARKHLRKLLKEEECLV